MIRHHNTEIPYMVNKANYGEKTATVDLMKRNWRNPAIPWRIRSIKGMRVVLMTKARCHIQQCVLNNLKAHPLSDFFFSVNNVAPCKGRP